MLQDSENMVNTESYLNNTTTHNSAQTPNAQTLTPFVEQEPKVTSNDLITAYYEILTVNMTRSGKIEIGQQLQGTNGKRLIPLSQVPLSVGPALALWAEWAADHPLWARRLGACRQPSSCGAGSS